jgi:hypothetical protein
MSEQTQARGAAAYQEQRAEIAKRNADAKKRGQAARKSHDREVDARDRAQMLREGKELEELNAQIARRGA